MLSTSKNAPKVHIRKNFEKFVRYGNIIGFQKNFFVVKYVQKTRVFLVKYAPQSTQVCIKPLLVAGLHLRVSPVLPQNFEPH
jgi:hypothetical protein